MSSRSLSAGVLLSLAAVLSTAVLLSRPADSQERREEADLSADPRLQARVDLAVTSEPVEQLLARLQRDGYSLKVAVEHRYRRVSCFGARNSVRQWMEALANVTGLTWIRGAGRAPLVYELWEHPGQRNRRRAEREGAALGAARRAQAQRRALEEATQQAARDPSGGGPVSSLLGSLTREQRDLLLDVAVEPLGVISASNDSHIRNRVLGLTPLAGAPPAVQSAVRGGSGLTNARFGPENGDWDGWAVGVVGQSNLSLVLLNPRTGQLEVDPTRSIHRRGVPGVDTDDDVSPVAVEALTRAGPGLVQGLPRFATQRLLRFDPKLNRRVLPGLLQEISRQSGLSFCSDDYLYSREHGFSWLLTDQPMYSLSEALSQVGRAFVHQFAYRDGIVRSRTLISGWDALCEPPDPLFQRLRGYSARRQYLDWHDYLAFGGLPLPSSESVTLRGRDLLPPRRALHYTSRQREVLAAVAALGPEELREAEGPQGVDASRLSPGLRTLFWRLVHRRVMVRSSPGATVRLLSIHVGRKPVQNPAGEEITVRVECRPKETHVWHVRTEVEPRNTSVGVVRGSP